MKGTAERQALPPAFMRGEGRAAAGGVLRRGGDGPLSHGFAVPALPRGEPRELRSVLAPRIYEGGGPRSGRGSPPQRRGKPPQSRLRRASSPRGEAEGASHRSCPRIYEGGGPRSGRGSPSPGRMKGKPERKQHRGYFRKPDGSGQSKAAAPFGGAAVFFRCVPEITCFPFPSGRPCG